MKKALSIILAVFMVASVLPFSLTASAATSGYYTYSVSYGEAIITDVDASISGNVTIPSKLGGYLVTSIGINAFEGCTRLTSITIPNSVTYIGDWAFYDCTELTSITIPDSVTYIGDYAFYDCTWLTSITIPNSVTSIGDETFSGCYSLTSITIGNSVTSIGRGAFSDCTWLTSITIPDSVTSIGDYAFSGCTELTSITIPNSVTSIGYRAFRYCTRRLTSITVEEGNTVYHSENNCLIETESKTLILGCKNSIIPTDGSVTSIGDYAFFYCTGLTSITIGNSVTSIGDDAFSGCTGLTSITIPESVTSIGDYAFSWCTGLTSVTIPDSVTSIGSSAFYECSGLTSITIPDSVTSIGEGAFYYCTGLTSIKVEDGNTFYHSKNNCLIETESKTLISGCKNSIIPTDGSVTSIGEYAFDGCTGLTSITIPNSVTSIGDYAFYECTDLTSITIPNSVTSIGEEAFYNCTGLEDVWYTGSEEDRNDISIGSYNNYLLNATWHYNYVPTPEIKYGLVTENEEISASDALAILQASIGKIEFTEAQKIAADVNGDGTLTAYDALLTLQYSVGKIDKFPVEETVPSKICYLTFDDGPSDNTLKILDILKKYNVKATFFVIGSGKLEYTKRMVEEGHTVALHSDTHNFSQVYASPTAYYNDLQAISDKVEKACGVRSNIVRFPGGTSNTMSKSYCSGIMTTLSQELPQKGYYYFDWNVDSGDASGNNVSVSKIMSNIRNYGTSNKNVVVLMHDTAAKKTTVEALPQIIEYYMNAGYGFAALTPDSEPIRHKPNN